MVRQVKSWQTCMQLGIAAVAIVVTGAASAKATPIAAAPASALARCRSTETLRPSQAEIETLQGLILKYQVSVPRLKTGSITTRCQVAYALELTVDRINGLLAASPGVISNTSLVTLKQLYESYRVELASLYSLEDDLETGLNLLPLQKYSTTTKLSGEWIMEPQFNEPPLPPLPPLPPNGSNAPAAPTDIQALDALTERHGCITRDPDKTFPGKRETTRYEFAAALNACIDRVEQLMAGGTVVNQADLSTLHQLETAYAVELSHLRRRVAQLEERTRRQEQQQAFEADLLATLKLSSTIKLSSDFLSKPKPSHIRTEPTPPPAPPNAGKPAALADFQAFAPVVQRYGCVVGFFDQFSDKLTRIEFAAALNNCVDRVNDLVIGGSVVSQEDLLTLKRLEASYSVELAVLRFRIDALEARIKKQEQQPFSPTTKLHVETILELSGTAGGNR